jgi:hypothetical protein
MDLDNPWTGGHRSKKSFTAPDIWGFIEIWSEKSSAAPDI